jgi:16S rRNA (adenine1518-N6/adenine1519-N6)-dimethyltransferase
MVNRNINVRSILNKYGLKPKSSWSQNFLVDQSVLEGIVEAAITEPDKQIVELGAGIGALTARLARDAKHVVAVERDREMVTLLKSEFAGDLVVEILEGNAATLNWAELHDRLGEKPIVVGNLPYHMAAPILFNLIEAAALIDSWVVMVQKEMAERIVAKPKSRKYGVMSILLQRHAHIELVLDVAPQSFMPAPKVWSSVLKFCPLENPSVLVEDEKMFVRVVKGAFSQRRKQIRNSLIAALGAEVGKPGVERALSNAQIDPKDRAEQLSIDQFAKLSDAFFNEINKSDATQ